jgi:hypothetical protein
MWDTVNQVGLRGHYVCSVLAARHMAQQNSGLIVNISSVGGLRYLFNVPYGVGKAGLDRMSADMALELRKKKICCVSLWPGAGVLYLAPPRARVLLITPSEHGNNQGASQRESKCKQSRASAPCVLKCPSQCVYCRPKRCSRTQKRPSLSAAALLRLPLVHAQCCPCAAKQLSLTIVLLDRQVMNKTGRVLITGELADEYRLTDIDGRRPDSFRQLSTHLGSPRARLVMRLILCASRRTSYHGQVPALGDAPVPALAAHALLALGDFDAQVLSCVCACVCACHGSCTRARLNYNGPAWTGSDHGERKCARNRAASVVRHHALVEHIRSRQE